MSNILKNYIELDISKLVKAVWNYKENDPFMQKQLEENLKKNGQIENIIVRELDTGFYEVCNGNHRFDAIKSLGWDKVVAFNLGKVSEASAKRIAIVTNETRFQNDHVKFTILMDELAKEFSAQDLSIDMPFTIEQIENFTNLVNYEFEGESQKSSSSSQSSSGLPPVSSGSDYKTISLKLPLDVAFQFEAQMERFKKALHPDEEDLDEVNPTMAIQAMVQKLIQLDDEDILL